MQVNRSGDSILYRSGMNLKIKRNLFIRGIIHAGVQRVGFHRSDHAAHSRQALSNCAFLRLLLEQDARTAQEASRGGKGDSRAQLCGNSGAKMWCESQCGGGNHRASRAQAAAHPVAEVAGPYQEGLRSRSAALYPMSSRDAHRVAHQRRADRRAHLATCWLVGG